MRRRQATRPSPCLHDIVTCMCAFMTWEVNLVLFKAHQQGFVSVLGAEKLPDPLSLNVKNQFQTEQCHASKGNKTAARAHGLYLTV